MAKFVYQLNDGPEQFDMRELGEIPIMVKVYHLHDVTNIVQPVSSGESLSSRVD